MSQRVGEVVTHHLGMARSARGEVHEHGVGIVILGNTHIGHRLAQSLVEVEPAVGYAGTYGYAVLERVAVGARGLYIVDDVVVATGHDGLDAGGIASVLDVV